MNNYWYVATINVRVEAKNEREASEQIAELEDLIDNAINLTDGNLDILDYSIDLTEVEKN
jgi:hypothetical protein